MVWASPTERLHQEEQDKAHYNHLHQDLQPRAWGSPAYIKRLVGDKLDSRSRLVAKGYNKRFDVDFEETYSPVAMTKPNRILLSISAYYYYETWQIDVKMMFLNSFIEEEIYISKWVSCP
ncbi:Copia protein [Sesamum angolense]|uniref:Copia protein n=1 Tax=Sesamum angolense TaxID=2727404 RepID=A0AAE2BU30_9LAMI|nr:Copia protein [Sesamum angolense]